LKRLPSALSRREPGGLESEKPELKTESAQNQPLAGIVNFMPTLSVLGFDPITDLLAS
jgi:hypothetical protein